MRFADSLKTDRKIKRMDKLGMYENFMPSIRMTLFYDEIYSSGLDPTARFPVDRYSRIAEKIQEMDTDRLIELKKAQACPPGRNFTDS